MRPSVLNLPRDNPRTESDALIAEGHEGAVQGHIDEKNAAIAELSGAKAAAVAAEHAAAQAEARLQEALDQGRVQGDELAAVKADLVNVRAELASAKTALEQSQADLVKATDALAAAQAENAALKTAEAKPAPDEQEKTKKKS